MANAASGEPLAYRNAVVLWSAQSAQGTAVTPATAGGLCMVGRNKRSENQAYYGPGSENYFAAKGGSIYTEFGIRIPAVQTGQKNLLLRAIRSSGMLPWTTFGFGYQDDQGSPNRAADQIQDCKINSLRLGLDASGGHGPLTAELNGVGGLVTALTSLAPGTLTSKPWFTYEAVLQRAGSAYQCRSFELSLEHNLSRDHCIPGTAPASFVRGFSYLTEHAQAISGQVSRYAALGVDPQAATIPEFTMSLVLTNLQDSATLTIALTDVNYGEETVDVDEGGIYWSTPFQARTVSIS